MQRMSCDYCRSLAERSQPDAGPCVRLLAWRWGGGWVLGWPGLGWRLGTRGLAGVAPRKLGLGWTALRRGARVLLMRLCRSTTRAKSMGSTLGFGESLLVRVDRFVRNDFWR